MRRGIALDLVEVCDTDTKECRISIRVAYGTQDDMHRFRIQNRTLLYAIIAAMEQALHDYAH